MKIKEIKVYEYSELSPEAKEKALNTWRTEDFDGYGLQVALDERIQVLLEENGITPIEDIKGYPTKYAKVYWSLSCCQGDGVCFENTFTWKQYTVYIKHSGRYYHSNSTTIEIQETDNLGFHMDDEHEDVKAFDALYHNICKTLEREGYEEIDSMQSEDAFIEECNANEWTFREDGTMENAN